MSIHYITYIFICQLKI